MPHISSNYRFDTCVIPSPTTRMSTDQTMVAEVDSDGDIGCSDDDNNENFYEMEYW